MSMYKVGDIVVLKSGSPPMTVIQIHNPSFSGDDLSYRTSWFAGKKNETAVFPENALVGESKQE